jgi:hypothetical protein
MIHDLRYNGIPPELMDKGRDVRVEEEAGAAAVAHTADIDAVDNCC